MIRVRSSSEWLVNSGFSKNFAETSTAKAGTFVQTGVILPISDAIQNQVVDYDTLVVSSAPDETFTYPEEGMYHKWTSIRRERCDGTIYNVPKLSFLGSDPNSKKFNYFKGDYGSDYAILMDDETHCSWLDMRKLPDDALTGFQKANMLHIYFYPVFYRMKFHGYDVSLSSSCNHTIWKNGPNGSFNQYRVIEQQTFQETISLFRLSENYTFSVAFFTCPLSISVLDDPEDWGKSLIQSALGQLPARWDRLSWSTSRTTNRKISGLRGFAESIRKPNIHMLDSYVNKVNWGSLAAESYQSLGMADINGLAYAKDLGEMGNACLSFAKTLRSIPSKGIRAAASAWLAVHYGFKLFFLDTKEMLDILNEQTRRTSSLSKCRAKYSASVNGVQCTWSYQVFYDQFKKIKSDLVKILTLSDATLTLENAWDMVPYSFIIDWFVNLGDVLQSLDNTLKLTQKHQVICAGRSYHGTAVLRPSQLGLESYEGSVSLSLYVRKYQRNLVLPTVLPSVTVNLDSQHLVESAALIISRR